MQAIWDKRKEKPRVKLLSVRITQEISDIIDRIEY